MNISKTAFKKYASCDAYYSLEQLYYHPESDDEELQEFVSKMFDSDSGDDLIAVTDKQLEALLPYYKQVEELAMIGASKTFGHHFPYYIENAKQKKFSFSEEGLTYYTFLDGFWENKEEAIVIEVKAKTTSSFLELSSTVDKVKQYVFKKEKEMIKLSSNVTTSAYQHLFNKAHDIGKYIYDIAIERYIIEQSKELLGKKVKYYLAILNSDYIYDENPNYDAVNGEEIINFVDVTDLTFEYLPLIDEEKKRIAKIVNEGKKEHKFSKSCCFNKKGECLFASICFPEQKEKGALPELLFSKAVTIDGEKCDIAKLIAKGYHKITDLPFDALSANQQIQYEALQNDTPYCNLNKINAQIDDIKYPLYHLDFESFSSPIPRFHDERPYSQSVFQYSIHIEKEPGICLEKEDNHYFLPKDFGDHRRELVENMIKTIDLSHGGSVLVYNDTFEKGRIKEFKVIFPEYKAQLDVIDEAIIDLEKIVKNEKKFYEVRGFSKKDIETVNYYHPNMKGKYSIKKVLPVFTNRSYVDMAVGNGNEAIATYALFKDATLDEIETMREDLIEYCGLDTYSMVEILRALRKLKDEVKKWKM